MLQYQAVLRGLIQPVSSVKPMWFPWVPLGSRPGRAFGKHCGNPRLRRLHAASLPAFRLPTSSATFIRRRAIEYL
jgi:hypothetical protein